MAGEHIELEASENAQIVELKQPLKERLYVPIRLQRLFLGDEEIKNARSPLRSGRACGHDGVPTEVLKNTECLTEFMTLFVSALESNLDSRFF